MARTFNRRPDYVSGPSSSDIKTYNLNQTTFTGINESKNYLTVDQNSFADAENMYVDQEGLLRSRPSLKSSEVLKKDSTIKVFGEYIVQLYLNTVVVNGVKFENLQGVDNYTTVFRNSRYLYIMGSTYHIIDLDNLNGNELNIDNFVYIPIKSDDTEQDEPDNLISTIQKTVITDDSNFDDIVDDTSLSVNIDNKLYELTKDINFKKRLMFEDYSIPSSWTTDPERVFVKYLVISDDLVEKYIIVHRDNNDIILLQNNSFTNGYWVITNTTDDVVPWNSDILDISIADSCTSLYVITSVGVYKYNINDAQGWFLFYEYRFPLISTESEVMEDLTNLGTDYYGFHAVNEEEFLLTYNVTVHIKSKNAGNIQGIRHTQYIVAPKPVSGKNYLDKLYGTDITVNISKKLDNSYETMPVYITTKTMYSAINTTNYIFEGVKVNTDRTGRYPNDKFTSFQHAYIIPIKYELLSHGDGSIQYDILIMLPFIRFTVKTYFNTDTDRYHCYYDKWINNTIDHLTDFYRFNFAENLDIDFINKFDWQIGTYCSVTNINETNSNIFTNRIYDITDNTYKSLYNVSIPFSYHYPKTAFYVRNDSGYYVVTVQNDELLFIYKSNPFWDDTYEFGGNVVMTRDYTNDVRLVIGEIGNDFFILNNELKINNLSYNILETDGYPKSYDTEIYTIYKDGKIYSNVYRDPVIVSYTTDGEIKPIIFQDVDELEDYYFVNDKTLYISDNRVETVGGIEKLYIHDYTNTDEPIVNIRKISSTELAVFTENNIFYVTYDSENKLYYLRKSLIPLGCLKGSDVITSYDGTRTIFPTKQGIVALTYQNFVATTEQTLTFLTDGIRNRYDKLAQKPIKFCQYKYWLLCYNEGEDNCLLFDYRFNAWWPWKFSGKIQQIVDIKNELKFVVDNVLCDIDKSSVDYKDFNGNIQWKLNSQPLHLSAPNQYKTINSFTLNTIVDDTKYIDECSYILEVSNYRKFVDEGPAEVINYKVDNMRVFMKRLHYCKIANFQYKLSNDDTSVYELPFSVSSISIKYGVKGDIR